MTDRRLAASGSLAPPGPPAHIARVEDGLSQLLARIRACRQCEAQLPNGVRPIVQAGENARIAIIGQAPGSRVHASGIAWDDDSGERLRGWLGLSAETFYDPDAVALVPMGFCYPGKGTGGDLPPRGECAPLWHADLWARMPSLRLTLLVGQYAQKAYLPSAKGRSMTEVVESFRTLPRRLFPLPHPAWRSRLWMARNPWFEAEVLPELRERVAAALG